MARYLAKRLLIALPVLFIISVLNFTFFRLAPGDPAYMLLPPQAEAQGGTNLNELLAMYRERLGLDKPLPVQYLLWLREILTGNLGRSMISKRPVAEIIGERMGPTIKLALAAMFVQVLVGISVGVLSAVKRNTWIDYVATVLSFLAVSVPNFFLALVFIYVFALKLEWFPTSGVSNPALQESWLKSLSYMVMPATVLGLSAAASLVRYTRSSMLEVLRQEYVTTARSKGLSERVVILGHALRNGLLPIITVISLYLPVMFSGAVIVERIFFWPGLGTTAIDAVHSRDYTVLMGITLLTAVLVMAANLLADVAYALSDPRIRCEGG